MTEKRQEVLCIAQELFRQEPDWVTFFREVLGIDGVVRKVFSSPEMLADFERSAEYRELQNMVARLREKRVKPKEDEPTTVITVRLPKSLHDSLRAEAHDRKTSMNRLCIAKLLQAIGDELMASESAQELSEPDMVEV